MGAISDLYRGRNNYDIVGRRRIWLTTAAVVSILSIVSLIAIGLNLSIDFKGEPYGSTATPRAPELPMSRRARTASSHQRQMCAAAERAGWSPRRSFSSEGINLRFRLAR